MADHAFLPLALVAEDALQTRCSPVAEMDQAMLLLTLQGLLPFMYEHGEFGLAAPQVGHLHRLMVIDCTKKQNEPLIAANPAILWRQGTVQSEETCLSFPDETHVVRRAARIGVAYLGFDGEHHQGTAEGIWAARFQHELDHLDGITLAKRCKMQSG